MVGRNARRHDGRSLFAKPLEGRLDSAPPLMQRLIVSGACGRAAAAYVLAQCSCFPGAYTFLLRNVDPVDDYSTAVAADEDMRWWTIRCAAAASSGSVRLRRSLPTALLSSAPLTRNKNENRPVVVPSHEPRTSGSLLSSSQEAEKRVVREPN